MSYGLHYYVKQERAKYRPLMYPNPDLKAFTLFTIPFDRCRNSLIQTFNHIYPPHTSTLPLQHASEPTTKPHAALYRRPSPSLQTPSTSPSVCQGTFPEPALQ